MLWLILAFIILFLAILGVGWILLPGISTYAARYYCGAVFSSGRNLDEIKEDLFFAPISLATCKVDHEKKEVTASVWGLGKRKARYVEGHGIKLVGVGAKSIPPDKLRNPVRNGLGKRNGVQWPKALNSELNAWLKPFTKVNEGRTHAVVVLHRGTLVGEVYARGIGPDTPLHNWSLTKSVMNALIGILIAKGDLSLDQALNIPGWSKDDRRRITVRNLLQMTSGLRWKETETHFLKVSRMLFMEHDVVKYSQAVGLAHPPGKHFAYASCSTNVLSGIIRQLFPNNEEYYSFARRALFEPLGMNHTILETDTAGNLVGSSFSMGTARDWGRFGQLYLNGGRIGGKQLLSPEWIEFSKQSSEAAAGQYGAHFWLNAAGGDPDLPRDLFYAAGFLGQRISIFPSQELVVVRMGLGFESQFDHNDFLRGVLEILKD